MSSSTLGSLGLNHEFLNSRAPLRFAAAFDGRSSRFRVYNNAPSQTVHAAFEESLSGTTLGPRTYSFDSRESSSKRGIVLLVSVVPVTNT